jgi:hypothetical protein
MSSYFTYFIIKHPVDLVGWVDRLDRVDWVDRVDCVDIVGQVDWIDHCVSSKSSLYGGYKRF